MSTTVKTTKELRAELEKKLKEYEDLQNQINLSEAKDYAKTISDGIAKWLSGDTDEEGSTGEKAEERLGWFNKFAKEDLRLIGEALAKKIPDVLTEQKEELAALKAKRDERADRKKAKKEAEKKQAVVSNSGITEDDYEAAKAAASAYDEYGREETGF